MLPLKKITNRNLYKFTTEAVRLSSNVNIVAANDKTPLQNGTANLGQPTAWTHPHLLKEGEIVPCVGVEEFKERRSRFMEKVKKFTHGTQRDAKNHTIIIPSATKKYISDKIPYVFRQNSDFFYLTGCLEPDTVLVMTMDEATRTKSTLFMRPKDKHAELWDGPRTGVDNSLELFGVDEAFSVDLFRSEIERKINENASTAIWYDEGTTEQHHLTRHLTSVRPAATMRSPALLIQEMRLFKSPAEINLMRKTCKIASEAINETIADTRPGFSEHHIFAMVDYKCRMKNASHLAYPPVVAAGTNATTIHYINNTQMTKSGDLVLMDAGCEYGGYTSDITRTWAVNGEFTDAQKVLYDVVLQVQKELIELLLQEGGETLDKLFETMCIKLGKYLQEVGVVPKTVTTAQALARAGFEFCPHHVSHYLGMDVHDTPLMSRAMSMKPGMCCTVEPGIYISTDRLDVPKEFRGIGIRIEDDVAITSSSSVEVLTTDCIKERSSLENLTKRKSE